jgi:hypothetical protein
MTSAIALVAGRYAHLIKGHDQSKSKAGDEKPLPRKGNNTMRRRKLTRARRRMNTLFSIF